MGAAVRGTDVGVEMAGRQEVAKLLLRKIEDLLVGDVASGGDDDDGRAQTNPGSGEEEIRG